MIHLAVTVSPSATAAINNSSVPGYDPVYALIFGVIVAVILLFFGLAWLAEMWKKYSFIIVMIGIATAILIVLALVRGQALVPSLSNPSTPSPSPTISAHR